MAVQRNLSRIFEFIFCNFDELPKTQATRIQLSNQIRLQKMLNFIYEHYAEPVTLEDIAGAADVSRSEAGRCFQKYMGCSPVDALIQYRLSTAHRLLSKKTLSLQEISFACGVMCVVCYLTASLSSLPIAGLVGCALCGLAVGIMWPGSISISSQNYPKGGTAMFAFLALAGDLGATVSPAMVGSVSESAGGNLKIGLLAATVFPAVLVSSLIFLKKKAIKK